MKKNTIGSELHAFRFEWLTTFLERIECGGSEAEAARSLDVSASTVNRHLGKLEAWLRQPLFTGDHPGELTAFGKQFEANARNIVDLLEHAQCLPPQPASRKTISPKDLKL